MYSASVEQLRLCIELFRRSVEELKMRRMCRVMIDAYAQFARHTQCVECGYGVHTKCIRCDFTSGIISESAPDVIDRVLSLKALKQRKQRKKHEQGTSKTSP